MSESKWVDKVATAAELLLADGTALAGKLYLAAASPRHSGFQTPGELLAETESMLPFHLAEGAFVLVGKAAVAAVRVPGVGEVSELLVQLPARVRLSSGHRLEGSLLGERGAGERLSDLMNTPDAWVRLEEQDSVCWVAKRYVVTVEPVNG
ncbi:MAG: hypothetical protein IH608_10395 [Proteobacteria bacterium]|nr:hypothetical protein [Pseudomonadota bacterium]